MIKFVAPEYSRDWAGIALKLGLAGAEAVVLNAAGTIGQLAGALALTEKSAEHSLETLAWTWLKEVLLRSVLEVISEPRLRSPLNKQELKSFSIQLVEDILCEETPGELTAVTLQNPSTLPALEAFIANFPVLIKQISPDNGYSDSEIRSALGKALSAESARVLVENSDFYASIVEVFFGPSGELLRINEAWLRHGVWIRNSFTKQPIFSPDSDETLPLSRIYLPLRCFWEVEEEMSTGDGETYVDVHRHIASLHETVHDWLNVDARIDPLRIITGGPGSGKSSFAKAFATEILDIGEYNVIFLQLQHMRVFSDLFDGIGQYTKHMNNAASPEGNPGFSDNPLAWRTTSTKPYLLIFDGLDELSHVDNVAKELSRKFLLSVNFLLGQLNSSGTHTKALVLGRDNACQDAMIEANIGLGKLLNVAPIHPLTEETVRHYESTDETLHDPEGLMVEDQRLTYWYRWQAVKGLHHVPVPEAVTNKEFGELNSEPLLLHLLLISDYSGSNWRVAAANKNLIYQDIFQKIFDRNKRKENFLSVKLTYVDFTALLECLGLASWRGNGRTGGSNNFSELRKLHLRQEKRFGKLEAAELKNVAMQIHTRRGSLDEEGFEFIHKSFGEYLAGKGLFYAGQKLAERLMGEFEPEDVALDWVKLIYEAQITKPVLQFLMNEAKLWAEGRDMEEILSIKDQLETMSSWCLQLGMPVHRLEGRYDFCELSELQINAETALFCVLSAVCQCLPPPKKHEPELLKRILSEQPRQHISIEGMSRNPEYSLQLDTSRINLSWPSSNAPNEFISKMSKRHGALGALGRMNFSNIKLHGAQLGGANLAEAEFAFSDIHGVSFPGANLSDATFFGSTIYTCNFVGAKLQDTNLAEAVVAISNLRGARFIASDVENTDFNTCDFGGYDGALAAELTEVRNLKEKQLLQSNGGSKCTLPDDMLHPTHWPEASNPDELAVHE